MHTWELSRCKIVPSSDEPQLYGPFFFLVYNFFGFYERGHLSLSSSCSYYESHTEKKGLGMLDSSVSENWLSLLPTSPTSTAFKHKCNEEEAVLVNIFFLPEVASSQIIPTSSVVFSPYFICIGNNNNKLRYMP